MAYTDNAYSRLVTWLKIGLPLLALALLSTLFLVARTIDPEQGLPFADIDVAGYAREQRVGNPTFAGVTQDGASVVVRAASAKADPDNADILNADTLSAKIGTPDGGEVSFSAPAAAIDGENQRIELAGGVHLNTSSGYTVTTDRLAATLDQTHLQTEGAVHADGPVGTLDAGQMTLQLDQSTGGYVLVFNKGIKLVYTPQQSAE